MAHTTSSGYRFVSKYDKGYKWRPKKTVYEVSDEKLTAAGGVCNLLELFGEHSDKTYEAFVDFLPTRRSNSSIDSLRYGLTLLSGFWYGHDCLDDMAEFEEEPGVEEKLEEVPSSRSMGNFLRDFEEANIEGGQRFILDQAISYRNKLRGREDQMILDMDSTVHIQSGTKIEGTGVHYKYTKTGDRKYLNTYESLSCYDELGLTYGFELRSGNTYSSEGASSMLSKILERVKKDPVRGRAKRIFRADSAFDREDVIRACMLHETKFVIASHGRTKWEQEAMSHPDEGWTDWQYTDQEIQVAAAKKVSLPRVQTMKLLYHPGWSENIRFVVCVKREWKEPRDGAIDLFSGSGRWHYHGVVTNITDYNTSAQEILELYKGRGNVENMIREDKYGMDLKHFPCMKMRANFAYGIMAKVAFNFYRVIALIDNPRKPKFMKKWRRQHVFIPGKIVKHARTLSVKIPRKFYEEVERLKKAWWALPGSHSCSTA